MITIKRTNSGDPDFRALVVYLDQDLQNRYGEQQAFYSQFNMLDSIRHVIVAYNDRAPVGCGAFKAFTKEAAEVKRMFVLPEYRGQGISKMVLAALEAWALESGYRSCVLETGDKQPEAIGLYRKAGYTQIPNYGQYADVGSSLCMQKLLQPASE